MPCSRLDYYDLHGIFCFAQNKLKGHIVAVLDTIKKILKENNNLKSDDLSEDTQLDSLDIDSLDMVELICTLEDEENIDFGNPDQEQFKTVGDLITYVESCKK